MSNSTHGTPGDPFYNVSKREVYSFLTSIAILIFTAFSISLATFFRKDFGRRYYTPLMFILGLIFMNLTNWTSRGMPVNRGGYGDLPLLQIMTSIFLIVGAYHFWKMWVSDRLNNHVFSYYDGQSRFEPIAKWLAARPKNIVFRKVVAFIGRFTLTKYEQEKINRAMMVIPSIRDTDRYAKMYLEPVFGLLIALTLSADYFVLIWLFMASISLFVSSYLMLRARRSADLDFKDNMLNAELQKQANREDKRIAQEIELDNAREVVQPPRLPTLQLAAEQLNPDLSTVLDEVQIEIPVSK